MTVTNAGDSSATGNFSTGTYHYNQLPSGNVWGANFVLSPPLLAIPETGFASIGPVGGPFSVTAQSYTLTNNSASSLNWKLSNTPAWLSASSSNGTLAAGAATTLAISLASAANTLAAGSYSGSIWISNLNNGFAQQWQFSLAIKTADYPIAVTGFNLDVVVENTAVGGNTYNYADVFDPSHPVFSAPICFYQAGLVGTNLVNDLGPIAEGLPQSGLFTSLVDHATTFQFAPYNNSNVLYLTSTLNSASLTLNTPAAYKSLSVLAASAQGGGNGTLVIHFADGTTSSAIAFKAANYLTTNSPGSSAAITNFGILNTGNLNQFGSYDYFQFIPNLYHTSINLQSLGLSNKPISSVAFTMPSGTGTTATTVTGIFALSGTESLLNNSPVGFATNAGALYLSGGKFSLELTNLSGQGAVVISASTNLRQWLPIYTNPSGFGTATFTDSNAGAFPHRFYRATTP